MYWKPQKGRTLFPGWEFKAVYPNFPGLQHFLHLFLGCTTVNQMGSLEHYWNI